MKPDPSDSLVLHRQLLLQLGDRLRRLRKARKLTTVEMAERAGISRMTLASVEAGDPGPSMGTYLRVMGVLGCAADLAFLAGDMVHPAQPGTAAARSHRAAPQVQIMFSADTKRQQAQDLLMQAPAPITAERLRELHIKLDLPKPKKTVVEEPSP